MRVEKLDPVPVRVAHVDKKRMPRTMPAGTKLDVGGKAHLRREIANIKELIGLRDAERGVMQARPASGRKYDVVRIAFALQEREQELVRPIWRNVLGQAKPQAHPELACVLHVRHQQLEMIEPLRHCPAMLVERDHKARL